jgi:hypothetical protein
VFESIHCHKYQNLTNSNQQTQSYKFTSFSLCGFDHRDAWNLHTNIIWSKRSTDFKELSPCSVWYPLKWYSCCAIFSFSVVFYRSLSVCLSFDYSVVCHLWFTASDYTFVIFKHFSNEFWFHFELTGTRNVIIPIIIIKNNILNSRGGFAEIKW